MSTRTRRKIKEFYNNAKKIEDRKYFWQCEIKNFVITFKELNPQKTLKESNLIDSTI